MSVYSSSGDHRKRTPAVQTSSPEKQDSVILFLPSKEKGVTGMDNGSDHGIVLPCLDDDGHIIDPTAQHDLPNVDRHSEESEHARIERLGRERPAKFKSFASELAFSYSIIASQFMAVGLVAYR